MLDPPVGFAARDDDLANSGGPRRTPPTANTSAVAANIDQGSSSHEVSTLTCRVLKRLPIIVLVPPALADAYGWPNGRGLVAGRIGPGVIRVRPISGGGPARAFLVEQLELIAPLGQPLGALVRQDDG